ncbi:MAG: hypothetical protein AAFN92_01430 [Bacteroidota bacterium]
MRWFVLLLLFCLTVGCASDSEERNIRLTLDERERLDELVTTHMDSLRPLYSRRCAESFDDRVAVAVDSIVQRRLEEEARLRARIPQNLRNER